MHLGPSTDLLAPSTHPYWSLNSSPFSLNPSSLLHQPTHLASSSHLSCIFYPPLASSTPPFPSSPHPSFYPNPSPLIPNPPLLLLNLTSLASSPYPSCCFIPFIFFVHPISSTHLSCFFTPPLLFQIFTLYLMHLQPISSALNSSLLLSAILKPRFLSITTFLAINPSLLPLHPILLVLFLSSRYLYHHPISYSQPIPLASSSHSSCVFLPISLSPSTHPNCFFIPSHLLIHPISCSRNPILLVASTDLSYFFTPSHFLLCSIPFSLNPSLLLLQHIHPLASSPYRLPLRSSYDSDKSSDV